MLVYPEAIGVIAMTDIDAKTTEAILADLHEARTLLADIRVDTRHGVIQNANTASHATNNNHFGGVGIWAAAWIASVCCAAMMSAGLVFVISVNGQTAQQNAKIARQDEQLSRMQDYLNAIYSIAPQLKPKEK